MLTHQMILCGSKSVTSHDPATGKRHWIIDGPTEQFVASMVYRRLSRTPYPCHSAQRGYLMRTIVCDPKRPFTRPNGRPPERAARRGVVSWPRWCTMPNHELFAGDLFFGRGSASRAALMQATARVTGWNALAVAIAPVPSPPTASPILCPTAASRQKRQSQPKKK